jgi:hypothetical protein
LLIVRRIITEQAELLRVAAGQDALLQYYANALSHLLPVAQVSDTRAELKKAA